MLGYLETKARLIVRWGLYPAVWIALLFGFYRIMVWGEEPSGVWAQTTGPMLPVFLVIEILLPYEKRWAMTFKSFLADMKFALSNGATIAVLSAALAWFSITTAGDHPGPATDWPVWAQVVAALLIFEAINYTLHRAMHQMGGPLGWFLWRSHAAHHLPPRLYLVMHAVFHPVNAVIIQTLAIVIPVWAMGYGPQGAAIFFMINGMTGLISHFNVDVRAGWFNYVFITTETHRYHHAASVGDAGNFGATLSIFDQMFGTFVYRPGVAPAELGVDAATGLPVYERFAAVMALPFRRAAR